MSTKIELKVSARRQVITGFLTLILLVAGLGYWVFSARITGAVIAPGIVEVESNRQIVQHPEGGVVRDIYVSDGQQVVAGAVLIRLDTAGQERELSFAQAQLFELRAQQNRLRSERAGSPVVEFDRALIHGSQEVPELAAILDGQRALYQVMRRTMEGATTKLSSRKQQITAQIGGIQAQQNALTRQLELIGVALKTHRKLLQRKLVAASAVLDLEREEARLSGRLGELVANSAAVAERLVETDLELKLLMTQHLEKGMATTRELDAPIRRYTRDVEFLRGEIASAEIRAPVSGVVYGMRIHAARAVLGAAEPLLYLIPQDRPLIVAMRVPLRHIDQVAMGQTVKLRLSALDQRTTPEVWGEITKVSADAIEDEATGATFYRAEMVLPAAALETLPRTALLLPGMPVEAFIRTGEYSPITYLIKPVADYFSRAFRES